MSNLTLYFMFEIRIIAIKGAIEAKLEIKNLFLIMISKDWFLLLSLVKNSNSMRSIIWWTSFLGCCKVSRIYISEILSPCALREKLVLYTENYSIISEGWHSTMCFGGWSADLYKVFYSLLFPWNRIEIIDWRISCLNRFIFFHDIS